VGGKSKEVTVGYEYYAGMHIVACHGPVDAALRIIVGEREAWQGLQDTSGQITIDKPDLFGGKEREGGVAGAVDVEFGDQAQGRNSYLQSILGATVPAHLGVFGLVLRKVLLSMMNPYVKPWAVEAQRIHKAERGATQWYDAKAAIGSGEMRAGDWDYGTLIPLVQHLDLCKYLVIAAADAGDYSAVSTLGWTTGAQPVANNPGPPNLAGVVGTNPAITEDVGYWISTTLTLPSLAPLVITTVHDNLVGVYVNGDEATQTSSTLWSNTYEYTPTTTAVDIRAYGRNVVNGNGPYNNPCFIGYTVSQYGIGDVELLDMNPAHIVRECLTNSEWGLGYADADIDDTSFTAAADTLYAEGFGLSFLWNKPSEINDLIAMVTRHVDGFVYVDPMTGLFSIKLVRGDYVLASLPTFTKAEIVSVETFARTAPSEMSNVVTVQWLDRDNKTQTATARDLASIQAYGREISTTIDMPGVARSDLAQRIAFRELGQISRPLAKLTMIVTRAAAGQRIGGVIKVTLPEYGLSAAPMRIVGIAYGQLADGKMRLDLVEDVFSLPAYAYTADTASEWETPYTEPAVAPYLVQIEAPYRTVVRELTGESASAQAEIDEGAGVLLAGASGMSADTIAYAIKTRQGAAAYAEQGLGDPTPSGALTADAGLMDTTITLTGGYLLERATLGTWAIIDAGTATEEIVVVSALNTTTGDATIARGALDTVPHEHLAGARLFFLEGDNFLDDTQYLDGESLDVKTLPKTGLGTLPEASAAAVALTFDGRLQRPYPPGNVQVNGEYFPAAGVAPLVLTWAHRDRTQQTTTSILAFPDASVGPEAGTTYTARLLDAGDDSVLESITGVTGTTTTLSASFGGAAIVELFAVRDGLESWQRHRIPVDFIGSDGLTTEGGEALLTEGGEALILENAALGGVVGAATVFNTQEAAPIRAGNKQVVFFDWTGYPGGDASWNPPGASTDACTYHLYVRKRGATFGDPDAYSIAAQKTVINNEADPIERVNSGLAFLVSDAGHPTDIGLNQAAIVAGAADVNTWQRGGSIYPSDWCQNFLSVPSAYSYAVTFPVGEKVNILADIAATSNCGYGEWEIYAYSLPAGTRPQYANTTVCDFMLGAGFEDAVATARPQITNVYFGGTVTDGDILTVAIDGASYTVTVGTGESEADALGRLAAVVNAGEAVFTGYGGHVINLNDGSDLLMQMADFYTDTPRSRFLESADSGATWTVERFSRTELLSGVSGVRFYDAIYAGTRFSILVGVMSAGIRQVIQQIGAAEPTITGRFDSYPQAGGIGLNVGAVYAGATEAYLVARLEDESQSADSLYLYTTTDGLTATLVGEMTADPGDPNAIATNQYGGWNDFFFIPSTTTDAIATLFKSGARWFLQNSHSLYYTDDTAGLTNWTRCVLDLDETQWWNTLVNVVRSGTTLIACSRDMWNECLSYSTDNGSTWTAFRPAAITAYADGVARLYLLGSTFVAHSLYEAAVYTAPVATPTVWTKHAWTGSYGGASSVNIYNVGSNLVIVGHQVGDSNVYYSANGYTWAASTPPPSIVTGYGDVTATVETSAPYLILTGLPDEAFTVTATIET
jgi:hypothetical protein